MAKKNEAKKPEPVAETATATEPVTSPVAEPVTEAALDPNAIGKGDDIAPPEVANASVEPPADPTPETSAEVSGDGSGEALPPIEPEPTVKTAVVRVDYRDFFASRPALTPVPGHVKRNDFSISRPTAQKLNAIWGAMKAANVVGPDGVLVNSPDRALAALIHFVHDRAAE